MTEEVGDAALAMTEALLEANKASLRICLDQFAALLAERRLIAQALEQQVERLEAIGRHMQKQLEEENSGHADAAAISLEADSQGSPTAR